MMYYRKALELQAFLDMAKDEGASRNFVMITSKTCVHIPESVFPKREVSLHPTKNTVIVKCLYINYLKMFIYE